MKLIFATGVLLMSANNALQLQSPDFKNQDLLKKEFAENRENKIPRLQWSNAPANTRSFVLIVDDPDAPTKDPWVHWVVYNIPADARNLDMIQGRQQQLKNSLMQGKNSWNRIGWDGPNPPSGKHRYIFTLYALDSLLNLKPRATKQEVVQAMNNHIVAQAQLIGLYEQ